MDDVFGRRVLEQEAAGTGSECLEGVLVEVEGGEDEYASCRLDGDDPAGPLETVDARHADVQDCHRRPQAPHQAHGLGTVGPLADDAQVGLPLEDPPQAGASQRLIVNDDELDGHEASTARGSTASTRKPPPGIGPACIRPSYSCT